MKSKAVPSLESSYPSFFQFSAGTTRIRLSYEGPVLKLSHAQSCLLEL